MPSVAETNGAHIPVRSKGRVAHPLEQLNAQEVDIARDAVLSARDKALIAFRSIFTEEPPKAELLPFLEAERDGKLSASTPRPARQAMVQYDLVNQDKTHDYMESVIDLQTGKEVKHRVVDKKHQAALTVEEFRAFETTCLESQMFKDAVAKLKLPAGFDVAVDPWPYGGPDADEIFPRYTQGLAFAKDMRSGNPDSNHYGFPLPLIPVMDTFRREIVRIDKLATGGHQDGLSYDTHPPNLLDHCIPAEYVPELLDIPMRKDVKPLNVIQPDGASFTVTDESLIEWQKWRFRVGFTPREGAVLHDICYDGRSIMYRLSLSEMTVPYGDPRAPFHRKQAFDFGDGGAGRSANNLALGCDCLGVIKYLDAVVNDPEGKPSIQKNVVCIHEQDGGIAWKHTNFRTNRAVVTRSRELVIQFIITLANYEYIFAYKFDQAAGITVETRATGIVSVVNIDKGKTSPYGNIVSPGTLAQNHQHIFAVRMDPCIDGPLNTVAAEESLPIPMNPTTNPPGNAYEVRSTPITTSSYLDASPFTNLTIKMLNPSKLNPISGKPVAYKFIPTPSQLILADPKSIVARRAQFATHHVWVTAHRDNEFWAGGEFTNQSQNEVDGVADAVARNDPVENKDVVVWSVFGLTHNPRVEDWPVMPMEKHELHIRPADFFTANPALDVPGNKNITSVEIGGCCNDATHGTAVQEAPTSHLQGTQSLDVNANGANGANGSR